MSGGQVSGLLGQFNPLDGYSVEEFLHLIFWVVKVWFPVNVIQMLVQAIGLGPYEFIPVLGFCFDTLFRPMLKMQNRR